MSRRGFTLVEWLLALALGAALLLWAWAFWAAALRLLHDQVKATMEAEPNAAVAPADGMCMDGQLPP
jgi:prepilin-type N-terminal cleavage/methylation domain-containing protein